MFDQLINHLKNTCPVKIYFENDQYSYGFFDPIENHININLKRIQDRNKSSEYVLFHELAHMTGVRSRLGRLPMMKSEINMSLVTELDYKNEESIADLIAIRLLSHFNLLTPEIIIDHENYIRELKTETPLSDFVNSGVEYILNNWLKDFELNSQKDAA